MAEGKLTPDEALETLNALRSNVIGTQSASWSNTTYPLVAILNAAGLEYVPPAEQQMREHMDCYGGAGGYPGAIRREPSPGWCEPVGRLENLTRSVRRFLDDPTDENREFLRRVMGD